jgi:amino acid transporter
MANLAQIAGQYGFSLVGAHGLVNDTFWTTFAGVTWIVLMTAICYVGIEISARLQYALLAVEVVMLALLSGVALVKVFTDNGVSTSVHPAWSWFNPFQIHSFGALTTGMLLAVFIYWGWDTAVSVNEETRDRDKTPGRAAVTSTFLLLGIYALVTVAAQAFAGIGDKGIGLANTNNSGDVLSVLGNSIFGHAGLGSALTKLLVIMVLTSATASTLTTILPTARTTLSMAAYRAIPQRFARVHKRYLTPTWSTVGMGLVSIAFYVMLTLLSKNVLKDTIASVGLLIAFYYGLTGFICVWHFRHQLTRSWRDFLLKGLAPFLGGAMLASFFVKAVIDYSKPSYGSSSWHMSFPPHWHLGGVVLTGVGALVVGAVLMLVYRLVAPAYFKGEVIARRLPPSAPAPSALAE